MNLKRRFGSLTALVLLIFGCSFVWLQQNAIGDWFVLREYQPSATISQLATDVGMTGSARHYLYVNRPGIEEASAFNKHCTNEREQTVVLGCYLGNRQGIYLFNVQTPELHGVMQVTAAHEMLHQAYDRLSAGQRKHINDLLQNVAQTITDPSLLEQINAYKQSEPDAVSNELHSLLGTQVAHLPNELETYYKQYFTDRSKVVTYYDGYQAAFRTRQEQIKTYDKELSAQKADIESREKDLESQVAGLNQKRQRMDAERQAGNTELYNQEVPVYNALVDTYNTGLSKLKSVITSYNELVKKRNAIVLQEQQLQQDLSSKQLPSLSGQ